MRLSINQIRTDGGTQARSEINQMTVVEYAQAIKEGQTFPPIVVFYDGTCYWLSDGFHRLEASRMALFKDIEVSLKEGSLRDAILYAVGANAEHGLRRTPADKYHAVSILINDEEWSSWSDRMIARQTFTSPPFVAKVRSILTENIYSERTYTTKHGSTATMDTSGIGKAKKSNAESYSLKLQPRLWEKLQQYQEKMGLESLGSDMQVVVRQKPFPVGIAYNIC